VYLGRGSPPLVSDDEFQARRPDRIWPARVARSHPNSAKSAPTAYAPPAQSDLPVTRTSCLIGPYRANLNPLRLWPGSLYGMAAPCAGVIQPAITRRAGSARAGAFRDERMRETNQRACSTTISIRLATGTNTAARGNTCDSPIAELIA
jgi:hypothetical protein